MSPATANRWLSDAERVPSPGRRVVILASVVGLALSAIGGWLAWRSYQDRASREGDRVAEAAERAAQVVEQYIEDRIAVLESVSRMGAVQRIETDAMIPLFEAISSDDLGFSGGVGWADTNGMLRVHSGSGLEGLLLDLTERRRISGAVEAGQPFVSEALEESLSGDPVILLAVPTFVDAELTGILLASLKVDRLVTQVPLLAPHGLVTRVVDRAHLVILENGLPGTFQPPPNPGLLTVQDTGVVKGRGLMGDPNRVVALANVEVANWSIVVEQDQARLLVGARNRFIAELTILGFLVLLGISGAVLAAQRLDFSHERMLEEARGLRALESLSERLASAPGVREVAQSARAAFSEVFGSASVVIGLLDESGGGLDLVAGAKPDDALPLQVPSILTEAFHADEALIMDADEHQRRYPTPRSAHRRRRPVGMMAGGFRGRNAAGAVGITFHDHFPPSPSEVELFEAMVPLLGDAFGRAAAMDGERRASRVFQHALLPRDTIGEDAPLQRAVRYIPAVGDVEVGGDWYDLWMIEEGRIGMVVGDVVGRGVEAAAAMGQLRSALRAIVANTATVGDALARLDELTGQISDTPSATVLLGTLDLATKTLALASAGHLPPLLADDAGVRVLHEARGAPIGFIEHSTERISLTTKLEVEDTLVIYSDGLVERRSETIDEGISRLQASLHVNRGLGVEALADAILADCVEEENPDDVALVCIRAVGDVPRHFTQASHTSQAALLPAHVEGWLRSRHCPDHLVDKVVEELRAGVEVVTRLVGEGQRRSDVMVEVSYDERITVTLELRRAPVEVDRRMDARILDRWGSGSITPTGPRLRFSVLG